MVTLKDIARECNVSFSTVSKALQGSSEISSDTIKLVQSKAEELGYHPNIAARTLRTNKTFDIGIIFEDKTGSGFQHQYFAKIISGLQEVAQSNNYDLTFTGPASNKDYDYYKHVYGRNFDGVAILSADFSRPDLQKVAKSGLPVATLDYLYSNQAIAIISDHKTGMTELTNYVLSKGHKKIALILGDDTLVTKQRKEAFFSILKDNNIEIPAEYLKQARYHDPELSKKATQELLALPEPPTCIFYPDDYAALGGIQELNSKNLSIGKDISIVGYDGIMLTSMMQPPLTTYEQDGFKIGKIMATELLKQIEQKEKAVAHEPILISGKLLKGATVADLNSSR